MEAEGETINAEAEKETGGSMGYPHLSLCVLDAVWKSRVGAATVRKVLARYCAYANLPIPGTIIAESVSPEPLRRFLDAMKQHEPEAFAAEILKNRQRTASRNGILKTEAAYRVAQLLNSRQIETPPQVPSLQNDLDFEREFHAIPGLGPASLQRLYALCGAPNDGAGCEIGGVVGKTKADKRRKKGRGKRSKEQRAEAEPEVTIATPTVSPHDNAIESFPLTQSSNDPITDPTQPTTELWRRNDSQATVAPQTTSSPSDRYTVRIREMPTDERPRERLQHSGAEALSHAELIAILLRTGTEQFNVIQVAERLLADNDGLRGVAQMTLQEMAHIPGIGLAKATQIKAAIELGRRLVAESPDSRYRIRSPQDIYNLLGPRLRDEKREHFVALLLDAKGGVMRQETISIGDLSSSIVNPREVFRPAVRHAASSIVVAHNHPSGDTTPSPEDIAVTRQLVEAGKLLSIELLDHLILGDNRYLSLKERNLI